jgi:hypothetical protein
LIRPARGLESPADNPIGGPERPPRRFDAAVATFVIARQLAAFNS